MFQFAKNSVISFQSSFCDSHSTKQHRLCTEQPSNTIHRVSRSGRHHFLKFCHLLRLLLRGDGKAFFSSTYSVNLTLGLGILQWEFRSTNICWQLFLATSSTREACLQAACVDSCWPAGFSSRLLRLATSFSKLVIISSASFICFLENSKARSACSRNVQQSKHMQIPLHPLVFLLSIPFFGEGFLGDRDPFSIEWAPLGCDIPALFDADSVNRMHPDISSTDKYLSTARESGLQIICMSSSRS